MRDALGEIQSVLVLGGASELALASVQALPLRRGGTVVLAGRDEAAMAAQAASLADVAVKTVRWDAAEGAIGAERAVAAAADAAGGDLDVVLAAAGVLGDQAAAEISASVTADVLTVNFVGVAAACVAAVQQLRAQGHGTLVVFSSVAGVRGRRDNFVYGSSKAGLDAFASGLADAVHGTGVTVVVIRPGFVHGRMTAGMQPAPLATTPEAVGAAVARAVKRGAPVTYVPSTLQPLFAVLQHAPRPVWRKLGARG